MGSGKPRANVRPRLVDRDLIGGDVGPVLNCDLHGTIAVVPQAGRTAGWHGHLGVEDDGLIVRSQTGDLATLRLSDLTQKLAVCIAQGREYVADIVQTSDGSAAKVRPAEP